MVTSLLHRPNRSRPANFLVVAVRLSATLLSLTLVALLQGCGQTTRTTGASSSSGHLVIASNNGNQGDTYVTVDPLNGHTSPLPIPGYLLSGFNRQFTKAAVVTVDNSNSIGPSTLSVSPIEQSNRTAIWTFEGDQVTGGPAWDPSGSQIGLSLNITTNRGGQRSPKATSDGLWVIDVASHHTRRLVAAQVGQLAWSPDGQALAYVAGNEFGTPTGIETVNLADGVTRPIAAFPNETRGSRTEVRTLSWAPDGKTIVVAYGRYLVPSGSGNGSGVDAYPSKGEPASVIMPFTSSMSYLGASYSPDGQAIAIAALAFDHDPLPPSTGSPTMTTSATGPPPTITENLQLVTPDGSQPRTLAAVDRQARLVG